MIKPTIKNYFNKNYFNNRRFNRGRKRTYYDSIYCKLINKLLKKNSNILEIGCSYGHLLHLLEKNHKTFGLDISPFAIKEASKVLEKTRLKQCNFEKNFSSSGEKFDCIIGIDVFEHFKEPGLAIKKCHHLLRKNGLLIIKVPNKSSIRLKLLKLLNKEKMWPGYADPTHYSVLELKDWEKVFKKFNFDTRIMASLPTKLLKNLSQNNISLFFNRFNTKFLNENITLVGKKYEN